MSVVRSVYCPKLLSSTLFSLLDKFKAGNLVPRDVASRAAKERCDACFFNSSFFFIDDSLQLLRLDIYNTYKGYYMPHQVQFQIWYHDQLKQSFYVFVLTKFFSH